jgi:hypothetical protein
MTSMPAWRGSDAAINAPRRATLLSQWKADRQRYFTLKSQKLRSGGRLSTLRRTARIRTKLGCRLKSAGFLKAPAAKVARSTSAHTSAPGVGPRGEGSRREPGPPGHPWRTANPDNAFGTHCPRARAIVSRARSHRTGVVSSAPRLGPHGRGALSRTCPARAPPRTAKNGNTFGRQCCRARAVVSRARSHRTVCDRPFVTGSVTARYVPLRVSARTIGLPGRLV